MTRRLLQLARQVAAELKNGQAQLVLAESCTAGLVAASLATVPGISKFLCGSAVTYQDATKENWLEISASVLEKNGAVSPLTAQLMAESVLRKTPQAHLAASVTGHLGPEAPRRLDGVVYVAVTNWLDPEADRFETNVKRFRLEPTSRRARQQAAAERVLEALLRPLQRMKQ